MRFRFSPEPFDFLLRSLKLDFYVGYQRANFSSISTSTIFLLFLNLFSRLLEVTIER